MFRMSGYLKHTIVWGCCSCGLRSPHGKCPLHSICSAVKCFLDPLSTKIRSHFQSVPPYKRKHFPLPETAKRLLKFNSLRKGERVASFQTLTCALPASPSCQGSYHGNKPSQIKQCLNDIIKWLQPNQRTGFVPTELP